MPDASVPRQFAEYAYFLSDSDVALVIPDAQQRLFGPPGGPGAANWFIHVSPPEPTAARPYVWRFLRIATYTDATSLGVATFVSATNWELPRIFAEFGQPAIQLNPILPEATYFVSNSDVEPVIPANRQGVFGPPGSDH